MHEDSIYRFLIALGVDEQHIESARGWVNSPCPMAPWTHGGGADDRPSFGIRISEDNVSYYYCFGCTPEGRRADWLLHNMFILTGKYPWIAAEIFLEEELHFDEDSKPIKVPDPWVHSERQLPRPLPYRVFTQYPMLQFGKDFEKRRCIEFLEGERGIPRHLAYMYQVRYNRNDSTLIFPLTDYDGDIYLLRARSRKEKSIWTMNNRLTGFPELEFPKLKDIGAWFGMWLVDWSKPVIAVEAALDVLVMNKLGRGNVVAAETSSVTEAQIETLLVAPTVILGFDADKAGEQACKRFVRHTNGRAALFRANWNLADAKDPGEKEFDKNALSHVMRNLEIAK